MVRLLCTTNLDHCLTLHLILDLALVNDTSAKRKIIFWFSRLGRRTGSGKWTIVIKNTWGFFNWAIVPCPLARHPNSVGNMPRPHRASDTIFAVQRGPKVTKVRDVTFGPLCTCTCISNLMNRSYVSSSISVRLRYLLFGWVTKLCGNW
jgi:hypothetical protein